MYRELQERKVKPAIPPRKNVRITRHGNKKGGEMARDKLIGQIRKVGRKKWEKQSSYHWRSIAKSAMFRFKSLFGEKLSSRNIQQRRVEVCIRCYAFNRMAKIGMPLTIKVRAA